MRKTLCYGAIALAFLAAGPAFTQSAPAAATDSKEQTSPGNAPSGQTSSPDHTVPSTPNAQPQAPLADQAKPAAVGPAQNATASTIEGPLVPGATPQTTPSTISAANAALDKLPTTALQLPLNEEQKKVISGGVASAQTQNSASLSDVHVADFLPTAVVRQEFSAELKQKMPEVERYKFVKLDKRVLVIDPSIGTVVGEITL